MVLEPHGPNWFLRCDYTPTRVYWGKPQGAVLHSLATIKHTSRLRNSRIPHRSRFPHDYPARPTGLIPEPPSPASALRRP